jgi:23S rRNA pseudouridine2605 synthase
MYLAQYLALSGTTSRRKAIELIKNKKISVNGQIIINPNTKVTKKDIVTYENKKIFLQKSIYILLNKPVGYITSLSDEHNRKTVIDLISSEIKERVVPVGRLDYDTSGLLLLTNDGPLITKLIHPSHKVSKSYLVKLSRALEQKDFEKLFNGIILHDGPIKPDKLFYPYKKDKTSIIVQLHSGRNRIVRRIFSYLRYKILELKRIGFCFLTLKGLKDGNWRFLTPNEINSLKTLNFYKIKP